LKVLIVLHGEGGMILCPVALHEHNTTRCVRPEQGARFLTD
jgi:hypothetical protein